ncbi:MAG: diphthine--ammonia ligase [Candidatus Delongbacteria bacterium]|nr:diphthine--ammonia ligase [Candidatus Delongbacteria bacterium]MBN2836052.1 diphthine--ammonia ligase [Candidatus Delongbacteria bacterium]
MKKIFCSWSGGKDSAMALGRAINLGMKPEFLLTMMSEDSSHTRSHHIPIDVLKKQAELASIKLVYSESKWETYEEKFLHLLKENKVDEGILGVFGDIDLIEHKEWEDMICGKAGTSAVLPLFNETRETLTKEFVNEKYEAVIIALDRRKLPEDFLGKKLSAEVFKELKKAGSDECGEFGEYHTIVTNTPYFSKPLDLEFGEILRNGDYSFLEIKLK